MIKKFAMGVTALVLLTAGVGLALPRTWRVERSAIINAPAKKIHPLIVDLKRWQDWSPWTRSLDPQLRNIYEGPADGVGARWSWLGPQMGQGRIEITSADEATGITLDQAIESDQVNAHATLHYSPEGSGTRVTWVDEGTLPPLLGLFRGMVEEELGANLDRGLTKLKTVVEGP